MLPSGERGRIGLSKRCYGHGICNTRLCGRQLICVWFARIRPLIETVSATEGFNVATLTYP